MLKVHVVRGDGHRYYVDDLAPGRAESSPVVGESPGIWTGGGAAVLGLEGVVEAPAFASVLEGRHPQSGTDLGRLRGRRNVSGYDLTFGAPKSVSILAMLAPAEIAQAVGEGHGVAVAEAVGYLGRSAVGVRRVHRGVVAYLPSTGMVAGSFVHRTSRALDPHLHTHLVVANVGEGVDGRWSAVDSRRIFVHAPAAQGIYHARLRLELSERLGAAWEVDPSGLGDVVGVDRGLRRLFSTRTSSIDEYIHDHQRTARSSGRTNGAFHATRPDKDRSRSVSSLQAEWRARAVDFGHDLGDLTRPVGLGVRAGTGPSTGTFDPDRIRSHLEALGMAGRAVYPRDLVAAVASSTTRGAGAADIESAVGRIADACRTGPAEGGSGGRPIVSRRWPAAEVLRVVDRDAGWLWDRAPDDRSGPTRTPGPSERVGGIEGPGHEVAGAVRSGRRAVAQLGR